MCSLLLRDLWDFFYGSSCVVKVRGNSMLGKNEFLKKLDFLIDFSNLIFSILDFCVTDFPNLRFQDLGNIVMTVIHHPASGQFSHQDNSKKQLPRLTLFQRRSVW